LNVSFLKLNFFPLERVNGIQAQIDSLSKELERCRAMLDKAK
jgi:hypothetical protein